MPELWTARSWSFRASGRRLAGVAAGVHERDRDLVADRAVRTFLIVVSAPTLQLFGCVGKRKEPVGVQAFRPHPPHDRTPRKGLVSLIDFRVGR